jgi:hypothetical protein
VIVSTESLLTSADAFGIATATPAQRAACRILDGQPLGELATHPDVIALVGGHEAIATLPSERGQAPIELVFLAAIRSAKTIIACAAAIRMALTVDVSRLGPGEVPRVSILSLKLDTSAVAFGLLLETIRSSRALSPLLIDATADALTLRHPSGREIEIACVAGAKAGNGLVARWSAGVIFDEAPRMNASSDAIVNLTHARSAVLGRLLPGAQCLMIGSPHAPHGDVYDLTQEHFGKPSATMVVLRGTGPMLNPVWWTPARCARLELQDPAAYLTDVCGEFADPESGLVNVAALRANTRVSPLELQYEHGATYAAAIDPSEGTARANPWTLVIVQLVEQSRTAHPWLRSQADGRAASMNAQPSTRRYRVVLAREWRGLSPASCLEQIARICDGYGLRHAVTDQYAGAANADLARRYGLYLQIDRASAQSKVQDFTDLATLIHTDAIELSPDRTFLRDLLSVKKRTTQGGVSIVFPKTGDGRHADYAPALCADIKWCKPPHVAGVFIPGL